MSTAFVSTNLVDLRAESDFRSERVNQALWGEVVKLGVRRPGWVKVTQSDGYRGWVDERFLTACSANSARSYTRGCNYLITAEKTTVRDRSGRAMPPHFVYYGTVLAVNRRIGGKCICRLPSGERFVVSARHTAGIPTRGNKRVSAAGVIREARRFLGVPYLWGGISPAGFDCSGFVRAIFSRFGIRVPRDTRDQVKAGIKVDRVNVRPGDLLFFNRHVGIALRHNRMIHASLGGGGVGINSLRPGDDDYRKDLDDSFVTARRLL